MPELLLPGTTTINIPIGAVEIVQEDESLDVGAARDCLSRFKVAKKLALTFNGVTISGVLRLDIDVLVPSGTLSATEAGGKDWDDLPRRKQSEVIRRENGKLIRSALAELKKGVVP